MGAGTKIVVKSLTNQGWSDCDDWLEFLTSVQTAEHDSIVLVANAQGVTDGAQIIVIDAQDQDDEVNDRSALYLDNTGSTSLTIGGDFSTMSNVERIYNIYYSGRFDGGDKAVSLIHVTGDLHLTLTTGTGAATAYKVETKIRTADTVYELTDCKLEEGLPVYTDIAISNSTMFPEDLTLETNTVLTGDLTVAEETELKGHLLAEDTTLVDTTTLKEGSVLKAGSIFSKIDAKTLETGSFADLSGDRKILLSDLILTDDKTLSRGAVLKEGSSVLSDSPVLKEYTLTEDKTLTSKFTVYKGSVINGETLTEDTTYETGYVIKSGSTIRTEASVGILLAGRTVLLKGSVLQKGQLTPDGVVLTENKILEADTVFEAGSLLLDGTVLAAGTVLRKGTMLEKGTELPKESSIAAGTVTTKEDEIEENAPLATDWILSTDTLLGSWMDTAAPVTLGGDMVLSYGMTLTGDTTLGGNTVLSGELNLEQSVRTGAATVIGSEDVTLRSDASLGILLGDTTTLTGTTKLLKDVTLAADVTLGGTTTLGKDLTLVKETELKGAVTLGGDMTLVKNTVLKAGSVVDGVQLTEDKTYDSGTVLKAGTVIAKGTYLGKGTVLADGTVMEGGTVLLAGTVIGEDTLLGDNTVLSAGNVLPDGTVVHSGSVIGGNTLLGKGTDLSADTILGAGTVLYEGAYLPRGTVIGAGTELPVGTTLFPGQYLPAGTLISQGNILPKGTKVYAGTVKAAGVLLSEEIVLTADLLLVGDVRLGGPMTLGQDFYINSTLVAGVDGITLGGDMTLSSNMEIRGTVDLKDDVELVHGATVGTDGLELTASTVFLGTTALKRETTLKGTSTLAEGTILRKTGDTAFFTGTILAAGTVLKAGQEINGTAYTTDTTLDEDVELFSDTVLLVGTKLADGTQLKAGQTVNGTIYTKDTVLFDAEALTAGIVLAAKMTLGGDPETKSMTLQGTTTLKAGSKLAEGTLLKAGQEINGTTYVLDYRVGEGGMTLNSDCILLAGTELAAGSELEKYSILGSETVLDAAADFADGTVLGDNTSLAAGTKLNAGTVLNADTEIGAGTTLAEGTQLTDGTVLSYGITLPAGTVLNQDTLIAAGNTLGAGTEVSEGTVFAAGTVIPSGSILPGNTLLPSGTNFSGGVSLQKQAVLGEDSVTLYSSAVVSENGVTLKGSSVLKGNTTLVTDLRLASDASLTVGKGMTFSKDHTLTGSVTLASVTTVAESGITVGSNVFELDELVVAGDTGITIGKAVTLGAEVTLGGSSGEYMTLNSTITVGENGLEIPSGSYVKPGTDVTVGEFFKTTEPVTAGSMIVGESGFTIGENGLDTPVPSVRALTENSNCTIKPGSEVSGVGYWYVQGKDTIDLKSESLGANQTQTSYAYVSLDAGSVLSEGDTLTGVEFKASDTLAGDCALSGVTFNAGAVLKSGVQLSAGVVFPAGIVFGEGLTVVSGTKFAAGNTFSEETFLSKGTEIKAGNTLPAGTTVGEGTKFSEGTEFHGDSTIPQGTVLTTDTEIDGGSGSYLADGTVLPIYTVLGGGTILGEGLVFNGSGDTILTGFREGVSTFVLTTNNDYADNSKQTVTLAVATALASKITLKAGTVLAAGTILDATGTAITEPLTLNNDYSMEAGAILAAGTELGEGTLSSTDNVVVLTGITTIPKGTTLTDGTTVQTGTDPVDSNINLVVKNTKDTSNGDLALGQHVEYHSIIGGMHEIQTASLDTATSIGTVPMARVKDGDDLDARGQTDTAGIRAEKDLYAEGSLIGALTVENTDFLNIGYYTVISERTYYSGNGYDYVSRANCIDTSSNAEITAVGLQGTNISVEQNQFMELTMTVGSAEKDPNSSWIRWFGHYNYWSGGREDKGIITGTDVHSVGFQTGDDGASGTVYQYCPFLQVGTKDAKYYRDADSDEDVPVLDGSGKVVGTAHYYAWKTTDADTNESEKIIYTLRDYTTDTVVKNGDTTYLINGSSVSTYGTIRLTQSDPLVWAGTVKATTGGMTVATTYKNVIPVSENYFTDSPYYFASLTDDNFSSYGILANRGFFSQMDDSQDGKVAQTEIDVSTRYIDFILEAHNRSAEVSNVTVSSVGIQVSDLTIDNMTDQFDINAELDHITLEASNTTDAGTTLGAGGSGNEFFTAGILADNLTFGTFNGNINSTVSSVELGGVSAVVSAIGIRINSNLKTSVLGGTITCSLKDVDTVRDEDEKPVNDYTSLLIGVQAAAITVDGRVTSSIKLDSKGGDFAGGFVVNGVFQAAAVCSTISIAVEDVEKAAGISVVKGFKAYSDATKEEGRDLFDFSGSVLLDGVEGSESIVGIASCSAMNLRVSGSIDVGVEGIAIQTQRAYNTSYELQINYDPDADRIEFSDTAYVVGKIGLEYGSDSVTLYSGATVHGTMTNSNGNLLSMSFVLTENVHVGGIYHSSAEDVLEDVTLTSLCDLTVNINNMADKTEYSLMEYDFDVSSYFTYGSAKRYITISYQGQTKQVTVPNGKGAQNGVSAVFEGKDGEEAAAVLVYLAADGKSLRIVSGKWDGTTVVLGDITESLNYSSARVVTANGKRTGYFSASEQGKTYSEYLEDHGNNIVYNEDEGTLRLSWTPMNLNDLFSSGNQTMENYYYEVEYRLYRMAQNGLVKQYTGESVTEIVNTVENGALSAYTYLTLNGIENGTGVEWRVRAISDSGKTTAWSSDSTGNTGSSSETWEQVFIDTSSAAVAPDVSGLAMKIQAAPSGDQTISAPAVRLSWEGAQAGTYSIDHYKVEYFYSDHKLSSEEESERWESGEDIWTKTVSATELYITNVDNGKCVYWRVSAVDSSTDKNSSTYAYGDYFANNPNDNTPPYFVSPGTATVHGKDSTHEQTWISFTPAAASSSQQEALEQLLMDSNFSFAYYLESCDGTPTQDSDYVLMSSHLTQEDIVTDDSGNFKEFQKTVTVTSTDTIVRTHAMMGVKYECNPEGTYSVNFYWTGAADDQSDIRSYVLQYRLSSQTWDDAKEITVASNATDEATGLYTYFMRGLQGGNSYYFRVYAIDSNGNSMVTDNEGTWNYGNGFFFGDITDPDFGDSTVKVTQYTFVPASKAEQEGIGSYSIDLEFSAAVDDYDVEGTDYESSNGIGKYVIKASNGSETLTWEYKYTRDENNMWGFHYTKEDGTVVSAAPSADGKSYTVSLDDLGKGEYTYTVTAYDFAGNSKSIYASKKYGDKYAPRFKDVTLSAVAPEDKYVLVEGQWTYSVNLTWAPADDSYQKTATDPELDSGVRRYYVQYRVSEASEWEDYTVIAYDPGETEYSVTISNLTESAYDFRVVSEDCLGNTDKDSAAAVTVTEYDPETGGNKKYSTSISATVTGFPKPQWDTGKTVTVSNYENTDNTYTASLSFKAADSGSISVTEYEVTVTNPDKTTKTLLYKLNDAEDYTCGTDTADFDKETKTLTIHLDECEKGEYSISIRAKNLIEQWSDTSISNTFGDTLAPRFKAFLKNEEGEDTEERLTIETGSYQKTSATTYTYTATLTWAAAEDTYRYSEEDAVQDNGIRCYHVQYKGSDGNWKDKVVEYVAGQETYSVTIDNLSEKTYSYRVLAEDKLGNTGSATDKGKEEYVKTTSEGEQREIFSTVLVKSDVTGIRAPVWTDKTITITETPGKSTDNPYTYSITAAFKDATGAGTNVEYNVTCTHTDGTFVKYRYEYQAGDDTTPSWYKSLCWNDDTEKWEEVESSVTELKKVGNDMVNLTISGFSKSGDYKLSSITAEGSCELISDSISSDFFGDSIAPRFKTNLEGKNTEITVETTDYTGGDTRTVADVTYSATVTWAPAEDTYQQYSWESEWNNWVDHYIVYYSEKDGEWTNAQSATVAHNYTDSPASYSYTFTGLTAEKYYYRVVAVDKLGNVGDGNDVYEYDVATGWNTSNPTEVEDDLTGTATPYWTNTTVTVEEVSDKTTNPYSYTANVTFTLMNENISKTNMNVAESELTNRVYDVTLSHDGTVSRTYRYVWDGSNYVCGDDTATLGENNTITVHLAGYCSDKGDYTVTIEGRNSTCQWTATSLTKTFGDSAAPQFKAPSLTVVTKGYTENPAKRNDVTYSAELTWNGADDTYKDSRETAAQNNWVEYYYVQYRKQGDTDWTTEAQKVAHVSGQTTYNATITGLTAGTYEYRIASEDKLGNTNSGEVTTITVGGNATSVRKEQLGIATPVWKSGSSITVKETPGSETADPYYYTANLTITAVDEKITSAMSVDAGEVKNIAYEVILSHAGTESRTYLYEWNGTSFHCSVNNDDADGDLTSKTITVHISDYCCDKGDYTVTVNARNRCAMWTESVLTATFGDSTAPRFKETLPESTDKIVVVTQGYTGGETKTSTDVTYNAVVTWAAASDKYQDASETKPQDNGIKCYHVQYRVKGAETWENGPDVEAGVHTATLTGLSAAEYEYRVVSEDKLGNTDVLATTEVLVEDAEGEFPTSVSKELQGIATPVWKSGSSITVKETPGSETADPYYYTANLTITAVDEKITSAMSVDAGEVKNIAYEVILSHTGAADKTYLYEWNAETGKFHCSVNNDDAEGDLTSKTITVHISDYCCDKGDYTVTVNARNRCAMWTESVLTATFGDSTAPQFKTPSLTVVTKDYTENPAKRNDVTYSAELTWNGANDTYKDSRETAAQNNWVECYYVQYRKQGDTDWTTEAQTVAHVSGQTTYTAAITGLTAGTYEYRIASEDKLGNTNYGEVATITVGGNATSVSKELQGIATPTWAKKTITVTTGESAKSTTEAYCYQANLAFTVMKENITTQMNVAESELEKRVYEVTLKHGTEAVGTYSYQWNAAKQAYYCSTNSDTAVVDGSTITVHLDCAKSGDYTATIAARNSCCMWTADTISTTFGDSVAPTVVSKDAVDLTVTEMAESGKGYLLTWNAAGFTDKSTDARGIAYDNGIRNYTIEYRVKGSSNAWTKLTETTETSYQSALTITKDGEKYEFRVYATDNLGNVNKANSVSAYCTDESVVKLQTVKAEQDGTDIVFTGLYVYDSMGVTDFTITVGKETRTIEIAKVSDGKYTWKNAVTTGGTFSVYATNKYGSDSNTVTGDITYKIAAPTGSFNNEKSTASVTNHYYWQYWIWYATGEGFSDSPKSNADNKQVGRTVNFSWDGEFTCNTPETTILYALEISDNEEFKAANEGSVHITSVTGTASPFTEAEFADGKAKQQVYVFTGITEKSFSIGDYVGNASAALNGMTDVYWRVVAYDSNGIRIETASETQTFTLNNTYYKAATLSAMKLKTPQVSSTTTNGQKTVTAEYSRTEPKDTESSYGYVSNDIVLSGCSSATIDRLKKIYGNSVVSSTDDTIRISLSNSSYGTKMGDTSSIYSGTISFNLLAGDAYIFSVISVEGKGREIESEQKKVQVAPDSTSTLGDLGDGTTITSNDIRYSMLEKWTKDSFNVLTDAENTLVDSQLIMNDTCLDTVAVREGEKLYIKIVLDEQGRTNGGYDFRTQDGNQEFSVTVYQAVKGTEEYVLTKMEKEYGAYQFDYSADVSYYACVELADSVTAAYGWTDLYMTGKTRIAAEKLEKDSSDRINVEWTSIPEVDSYTVSINGRTAFGTTETALTELGLDGEVQFSVNGTDIGKTDVGTIDEPKEWTAVGDNVADVFCVRTDGVWGNGYAARNMVSGTAAEIAGKNTITDIFAGSDDASVLVLTDDANGDALFLDDVYSALPDDSAQQARFTKINAVIAGKGDDLVDLTSSRYTGEGMVVLGGEGNDIIWGSTADDVISGGTGNDTLAGDGGNDIFCFGEDFGNDTVEQTADGSVTLWFKSGMSGCWAGNKYIVGDNTIEVTGVAADKVTLRFGTGDSEEYKTQYNALSVLGAFN